MKESIVISTISAAGNAGPNLRDVVVVVPAHNEEDRLPACLASLAAAADRIPLPVTVIVVLDGCTDNSANVIGTGMRTMKIDAANVGAARAAGFASVAAAGQRTWFAATDADSQVPPNWLTRQMMHHRNAADAVVGTVRVEWHHHTAATQRRYEMRYGRGDTTAPHGHIHGANLGVRADIYWRVGGFHPLRVGEDVDLVDRLIRADACIAWDRHNPVLTSDRKNCRVTGGFGDYINGLAPIVMS